VEGAVCRGCDQFVPLLIAIYASVMAVCDTVTSEIDSRIDECLIE
jgi:hypothetical protein